MEDNNWININDKLPQENHPVAILSWTYDDIILDYGYYTHVLGNPTWKLISRGEISYPAFWQELDLPGIVKLDFPQIFGEIK